MILYYFLIVMAFYELDDFTFKVVEQYNGEKNEPFILI
ncbi:hypothetical protein AERO9A_530004 [Aeromonas salmonicida]|nr:hypothetical protein AERO9A_530004 [Aeromonas salmonicida]